MKTILAADMHLKPGNNCQQNDTLRSFLKGCIGATRLVLVGDTFNCWYEKNGKYVGDYHDVLDIFSHSVRAGLEILLVSGNRDFIFSKGHSTPLGSQYLGFQIPSTMKYSPVAETGIHLMGWNCEFEQDGEVIHCSHGDMYCTDDVKHQLLRFLLMSNIAKRLSYFVPRFLVDSAFSLLRAYNREARSNVHTLYDYILIKDAPLLPIIDSGVDHVICGHLHQYSTREVHTTERTGRLTVLPCWAGGEYCVLENKRLLIKNVSNS